MIKSIAYCALHYGREYIKESIQSIAPFVEKIIIFYSSKPTFGHGTMIACPDTEEELNAICCAASDKVMWISGYWGNEGEHRHEVFKYSDGYDVCIAFDADEIFCNEDLPKAIEHVAQSEVRNHGVNGYINFWRSFDWMVQDYYRPIRFINLKQETGEGEVMQKIYHFSCCQRKEIMDYKYVIHGHASEIRENWLQDIYYAWTPENKIRFLHPASKDIWADAMEFDKNNLPESLKNHSNFNKYLI